MNPEAGSREDRMLGAIVGQFVGDALSLGSHWHYDLEKRAKLYPGGINGFEPPVGDHYHKNRKPGDFTHYGDAGLVLLRSLAATGSFDHMDYGRRFIAHFSDPDYPGYLDKATKGTIENADGAGPSFDYQQGADDFQTITISRLAPVVVRHAGDPELPAIIERAVRVCQNNDEAVAYNLVHGRILQSLIEGAGPTNAIGAAVASVQGDFGQTIRTHLDEARKMEEQTVSDATGEFGRACYLKSTFPSCLHAALRHGFDPATCLLETVRAGGDNASRASVIGAWMGAAHGASGLPREWIEKLNAGDEVLRLAAIVIANSA